jgi:hypothetical protein
MDLVAAVRQAYKKPLETNHLYANLLLLQYRIREKVNNIISINSSCSGLVGMRLLFP